MICFIKCTPQTEGFSLAPYMSTGWYKYGLRCSLVHTHLRKHLQDYCGVRVRMSILMYREAKDNRLDPCQYIFGIIPPTVLKYLCLSADANLFHLRKEKEMYPVRRMPSANARDESRNSKFRRIHLPKDITLLYGRRK